MLEVVHPVADGCEGVSGIDVSAHRVCAGSEERLAFRGKITNAFNFLRGALLSFRYSAVCRDLLGAVEERFASQGRGDMCFLLDFRRCLCRSC